MPGGLDLGAAHAARLGEADQEIHVLGSRLLLDDVLEQEVARVRVRALAVHGGAPPRELRHVLVVLCRPRAELGARQLALHPLLGERVQPAVPGIDGGLELLTERARRGHGRLLSSLAHLGRREARSQTRLACGSHWGPAYSKGPHCHSVDQPEDRVADAPYVERHQPLRAAHVSPLERVDDREVLADERLDAPGRHDGQVQTGRTCSRMCSRTSTSFAFSARLSRYWWSSSPSGRTSVAVALEPRARSSRKRASKPSSSSRLTRGPPSRTAKASSASRTS